MIFIGGVQPKTQRLEKSPRACPACFHTDVYLKRIDQYISLFFIPIIRIKKGETFLSCENCGTIIDQPDNSIFISTKKENQQQCGFCGKPLAEDFSFCPYCGKPL